MNQISTLQKSVKLEDVTISANLYQTNNPIGDVVLVHGFTGSKEDFAELAPLIALEGFRVLTFDNRGQNDSTHAESESFYAIANFAQDVIALCNHFELRKVHILGHSLGGLITQEALILNSNLFASATFFCTGPSGKEHWFDEPQFRGLNNENKEEIWNTFLESQNLDNPKKDFKKLRWIKSDAVSTLSLHKHLRSYESRIAELSKLPIHKHVVYGENDDVWPIEEQIQMAKELNGELTVLDGCGHCPNEENPTLTASALIKFWNQFR